MNASDLKQIDDLLQKRLGGIKKDIIEYIDTAVGDIIEVVDKNKADKKDVVRLEDRITAIEHLR